MKALLGCLVGVLITGCGSYGNRDVSVTTQHAMDGVKRIYPGVKTNDPASYGQSTYLIHSTSHLLLRFESLSQYANRIDTNSGKKIELLLSVPTAAEQANAITSVRVCPINKSWMMLATWELAHPFGAGDPWETPGGDYEFSACVSGTTDGETNLRFDVRQWYINYPQAQGFNHGLLVLSDKEVRIIGEKSASLSPRLIFDEIIVGTPNYFKD